MDNTKDMRNILKKLPHSTKKEIRELAEPYTGRGGIYD